MSWAAANVPEKNGASPSKSKGQQQRKRETVEAALNRLSSAYVLSMECIGGLHEANATILKRRKEGVANGNEGSLHTLIKLASAARDSLEKAVLIDPLIAKHAPTFQKTIQRFANRCHVNTNAEAYDGNERNSRYALLCEPRPEPAQITSNVHRSTVRQLAYLALTNYADLLMSVCSCRCVRPDSLWSSKSLLDKGVANKLEAFSEGCCWADDCEENAQRLAMAVLCDASSLDGSDPVVWLKLTYAARALGHIVALPRPLENPIISPFRRLERHALESGYIALPSYVPPNRAIKRLLEEFNNDELPRSYPPNLTKSPDPCRVSLDLTRYSWSLLARLLMKAFRDGSGLGDDATNNTTMTTTKFESSNISLRISPLLVFPSYVLGNILSYLPNDTARAFESTCRSLSVSVMMARVEREKHEDNNKEVKKNPWFNKSVGTATEVDEEKVREEQDAVDNNQKECVEDRGGATDSAATTNVEEPRRVSRSSKRVRSQQLTSDKREERLKKRKSVAFCLRAATLSLSSDDPGLKARLKTPVCWDIRRWLFPASTEEDSVSIGKGRTLSVEGSRKLFEASERISSSSLLSFLERVSYQKADPVTLMFQYLGHVALHIDEVFSVDSGDSMVLNSSIMGCFEVVLQSRFRNVITPRFFNCRDVFAVSAQLALELYAMDVLNAELRFKGCERHKQFTVGFEDDSNYVCSIIPSLINDMEYLNDLCHKTDKEKEWLKLKARAYWLVSGIYLWRSRFTRSVCESIEAEELGLKHIDYTMGCLALPRDDPVETVPTPHLESPARTGAYWKRLNRAGLSMYRDEIQASSVVSHAQQQFQERVACILKRIDGNEGHQLTDDEIVAFSKIGETLSNRYLVPFSCGPGCRHGELIDNFFSIQGDFLGGASNQDKIAAGQKMSFDHSLPVDCIHVMDFKSMSSPSILTILITCLQAKAETRVRVAELLIRLVLSSLARDEHSRRTIQKTSGRDPPEEISESEDDDFADEENGVHNPGNQAHGPGSSALGCGYLIKFLLEKLFKALLNLPRYCERAKVASSDEFLMMLHHGLSFCSSWIENFAQQPTSLEDAVDLQVFVSIRQLVYSLFDLPGSSGETTLKRIFLSGLVRIVSSQKLSFDSLVRVQGTLRAGRATRQRICILRAKFIGTVLCEIGHLLSTNLFVLESGKIRRAELLDSCVKEASDGRVDNETIEPPSKLAVLCDALLWFADYTGLSSHRKDKEMLSSFDRPIIDRLRIPLATAIVSFCGSASCTREKMPATDRIGLTLFYDSDTSARELIDGEEGRPNAHKEMLRVLCHVVHCVAISFRKSDDKEIVSFAGSYIYHTEHGPLLPLAVTRVLNHVADILLGEFEEESERRSNARGVWAREYPFLTGSIGALLDATLYKAYKCLHGFTLVGSNDKYLCKDQIMTSSTVEIEPTKKFVPENHKAAAWLYRCIVRCGKKTAPKAALEAVSAALPPLKESERSRMIKKFLFSTKSAGFGDFGVVSIATENSEWESSFEVVRQWENADTEESGDVGDFNEDNTLVRRGILSQLAQGDLPIFSSENAGKEDDRAVATRFERALGRKFDAILSTLCFGETFDVRAWFRAAQCLVLKAEAIADRLGLSKGFSRNHNFSIPQARASSASRLSLASLKTKQEQEDVDRTVGWIDFVGDDLSLYVSHQWSSFHSLKTLSRNLANKEAVEYNTREPSVVDAFKWQVLNEIDGMVKKRSFVEWQVSWGGMFVSALKAVAVRCLGVAMFIFHDDHRSSSLTADDLDLMPELYEFLGTMLYSGMRFGTWVLVLLIDFDLLDHLENQSNCVEPPGLLETSWINKAVRTHKTVTYMTLQCGSQTYGYPMHEMTPRSKREIAKASRTCFQRAVDIMQNDSRKIGKHNADTETWDLQFVIGKCYEKIASTFTREEFISASVKHPERMRQFELHMKKAFLCYIAALEEKSDTEHGEAGGSSHGSTEVFYRLHASRLKCLLMAADSNQNEKSLAEEEGLRLAEMHWFVPRNMPQSSASVRDRVWNVLADIVSALAKCRLDQSFFHRSVYRHAQALMWAPVLCDPVTGRKEGSKSTIPATKSYHLRGLNHATNAAASALAVMGTLFEKKRTQLCAVWVTTSYPPTAFESLNNSVRKYDSLRGKYISAYIECLRSCGNKSDLETLLRWISSSKRDLPSFFHATATSEGGRPEKSQNHDCLLVKHSRSLSSFYLLTGLKRQANSAMAAVLRDELEDSSVRSVENHLRLAYACFLRLNCTSKELTNTRMWKFNHGGFSEVDALCSAFFKLDENANIGIDPNNWSDGGRKAAVLDAALWKCKELFPSLSGAYYSKRANQKFKNQTRALVQQSGNKRSFEEGVPHGLSSGETQQGGDERFLGQQSGKKRALEVFNT